MNMSQRFGKRFTAAITVLAFASGLAANADAAPLTLSYSTIYNGTSIVTTPPSGGVVNVLAVPESDFYGHTFTAPTLTIPGTPGAGYGFYDDFVFTITGASANSITTTIDFGSTLQITNLQERLYSLTGNTVPTFGTPVGGVIDAWTSPVGTSGQVAVLPATILSPGTYVLEIRGNVVGAAGGSYAGVLNVTPVPVPLPAALPLLLFGLAGCGFLRRKSAA